MTWPIVLSIEYNQANWKEIRPILSSLNIYPIDGGSIVIGIWKLKFRYCKKKKQVKRGVRGIVPKSFEPFFE